MEGTSRPLADWGSSTARARHADLRTYLWRLHPIFAVIACCVLVLAEPTAHPVQLIALTCTYTAGLVGTAFVRDFSSRDGALLILGLLDTLMVSLLAFTMPDTWYFMLAVQLTIVSLGWVESRLATAALLVAAVGPMAVVGAIANVPQWPVFIALFVMATSAVSVSALWSFSDVPLSALGEALGSVRALVWQSDLGGVVTEIGGPTTAMIGLPAAEIVGRPLQDLLQPGDRARIQGWIEELEQTGTVSFVHDINVTLTVRTTLRLVRQEGSSMALHGVTVDISGAWQASEPQRRRDALVQQLQDGILLAHRHDGSLMIDQLNNHGAHLLGLSTDVGWEDLTAAHPELASAIENADDGAETDTWRHALQRERTSVRAGEVDARRDTVWLAVSCYRPDEGSIAVQLRDITEEVTQEERMRHDASHDAMTGLLNGAAFRTSLDRHLADGRPLVVFLLDLNGFKAVNDDMGHAAGDAVLQAVAKRLLHCTKDSDVVARLGGDEFVGLLSGDLAPGEIERLGQRIQSICSEAVTLPGGQQAKVSAAIGFARSFRDATSTELLAIADSEMYSDKRAGRDRRRPRTPHQL